MEDDKLKQINSCYEELRGLLFGMSEEKFTIYGGILSQYLQIIAQLQSLTQQDLKRFIPRTQTTTVGVAYCGSTELKVSANSLVAWLGATYLKDKTPHYIQPSLASSQVNVSQDVNVSQIVSVDIVELLTRKEGEFKEGTKERTFINKLKSGIRGVQGTAAIIVLIMQTATECGLAINDLHRIFS